VKTERTEVFEKVAAAVKSEVSEKDEKAEEVEKAEVSEKDEKAEGVEKAEVSEKDEKAEGVEKTEKTGWKVGGRTDQHWALGVGSLSGPQVFPSARPGSSPSREEFYSSALCLCPVRL